MGGLITIVQHMVAPLHEALILLGFSNRGLPDFLPAPLQALIGNSEAIRTQLPEVMRTIFDDPYVVLPPTPEAKEMFNGVESEHRGVEALKSARDRLLCIPGFRSMIPGSVSEEMAKIDVPVFLGFGDKDIAGPPHEIPASFSASRDVTLFVQAQAGHSHFIFPSRSSLFHRIARWCDALVVAP
jgi:pimeloyl-ACP methyl ester carboxylesterase